MKNHNNLNLISNQGLTNKNKEVFIFRYDPHSSFESLFEEFWAVVDGKKKSIEPHIVRSNSIEVLSTNLNKNRLQLFACVVEKTPSSLTELAQLLQKDYALVRREVRILEGMGLIKLVPISKKISNNQGSQIRFKQVKPVALYQRIVFDFPISARAEEVEKQVTRPTLA